MTHEDGAADTELAEQSVQVVGPGCQRELLRLQLPACPGAAEVECNHSIAGTEMIAQIDPERLRRAETVHEHDRYPLADRLPADLAGVDEHRLFRPGSHAGGFYPISGAPAQAARPEQEGEPRTRALNEPRR